MMKRSSVAEPVVGHLDLPAIAHLLVERCRSDRLRNLLQRSQRSEITGNEAAETAVTEAGLALRRYDAIEVEAKLLYRPTKQRIQTESQDVCRVRTHEDGR